MVFSEIRPHSFDPEEVKQMAEAKREEAEQRKQSLENIIKYAETLRAEVPSAEKLN